MRGVGILVKCRRKNAGAAMRAIVAVTAVAAVSLLALELSSTQAWSQTNTYNRCVQLARQQGLNPNNSSGRRYVNRCMQRGRSGTPRTYDQRNCPDDPRARSAFPAWMCP
jgi:hypothetical protein